ncbi:PREDICTED: endo-1,3;1,4-beta-D-glucanase-like [Prunus mume]|uniref:Endo-1,31,4-beta-D-glucanase-like n=1 Tax=Prunus mume TaxID=102107 RepID=A0ABM0N3M6_PRUMU|nr:PREDICTED: endo-1,3;1,4-beta-D-glucanase-like [Prunus mume]
MAGPQCCSNPPILNPSYGVDCAEKLGGLNVYAAGSPDSKLAIVLVSDVFGYRAPNLRKLAEKVAAAGFFVVVPNFFYDDPFVYDNNRPLAVWLEDHGTDKGFEDAKSIINALKEKGYSAIGAAGFCWGGKVVTELAKSDFVQAAVLLHPSFVALDDIEGVKVPMAVLGAEIDEYSPLELLKQFEEILAAKSGIDSYVKIFPKAEHSWTVRYNVEDEEAVKRAEEAHNNMIDWFSKHVK